MTDVKKFFKKFGINPQWVVSDDIPDWTVGNIGINANDSAEFPEVNDGDETRIDAGDVWIDGDTIEFKGTDNAKNREFFTATMVKGDNAGNVAKIVKAINDTKDHEGGPSW